MFAKPICLAAMGLLLALPTLTEAQEATKNVQIPKRQPGFRFYDAPSGSVAQFALGPTPAEREAHFRRQMLRKYDKNGNGKLDPEEEKRMRQDHYVQKKHFIKKWDREGDENFDDDDLEAFKKHIYAKRLRFMQAFDGNHDGALNATETRAMRAEVSKRQEKFWREFDTVPTPNKR